MLDLCQFSSRQPILVIEVVSTLTNLVTLSVVMGSKRSAFSAEEVNLWQILFVLRLVPHCFEVSKRLVQLRAYLAETG